MTKTSIKLGTIVKGNESLKELEFNTPVYLNVSGDQFCEYVEITRVDESDYEMISLWGTSDGSYTAEEVEGQGYRKHLLNYDKSVMSDIVESGLFEMIDKVSEVVTVDDLYIFCLEEPHLYNDDERISLSLDHYSCTELIF